MHSTRPASRVDLALTDSSSKPGRRSARAAWLGPLLGLPLAILLPGCPVYWSDGGARTCSADTDCPSGFVCDAGRCAAPLECLTDADCGADRRCESGMCLDGGRACRANGDCDVGSYCDAASEVCVTSSTCAADTDCTSAGFWCDFRTTCVPREPGACRAEADCSGDARCVEGRCTDLVDTCQFDRECAAGTVCLNNECTPLCTADTDCASGDACVGGFCRAANECTTSSICGGDHCVDARCLADCRANPGACGAETYCADDGFCRPAWQPTPFCTVDADCASGRVCRGGVCRTPCADMLDATCAGFDATLPLCRADAASGDYLCFATVEVTPECRVASDCGAGQDCVNATCRNAR